MPPPLAQARQPLRKSIRRLRWFKTSFRDQVHRTSGETGVHFDINEQRLTTTFLTWLKAFEAQKPQADADRHAYVGFAAGLMLRELIAHKPLAARENPPGADPTNPAYFWPEGYVYVAYCLTIRSAVLEQDFNENQREAPELGQIRTWWSFKENALADPSMGIAFLDLFAGETPDWSMPNLFRGGDQRTTALQFYDRKTIQQES